MCQNMWFTFFWRVKVINDWTGAISDEHKRPARLSVGGWNCNNSFLNHKRVLVLSSPQICQSCCSKLHQSERFSAIILIIISPDWGDRWGSGPGFLTLRLSEPDVGAILKCAFISIKSKHFRKSLIFLLEVVHLLLLLTPSRLGSHHILRL